MSARARAGVHVQLRLSSRPENVGVVRAMLTGVIQAMAIPVESADGLRTAVSEACNNVVLHAYPESEGPMEVDVTVRASAVEVVVRDRGTGILPRAELGDDELNAVHGVGLAVVQAFTDRVELLGAAGEGTEVRMEFGVHGIAAPPDGPMDVRAPPLGESEEEGPDPEDTLVSLAPTPLAGPVLAQIAAAMASRARFTLDRLSDAQLVTDAIAAHAPPAIADGRLLVRMRAIRHALEMEIGPLRSGAGAQLVSDSGTAGLEPVIQRLTQDVRIRSDSTRDVVVVRMTDERRSPQE